MGIIPTGFYKRRELYEKEKVLTIRGEDYTIYLDGKDIVNFENELETKLLFSELQLQITMQLIQILSMKTYCLLMAKQHYFLQ